MGGCHLLVESRTKRGLKWQKREADPVGQTRPQMGAKHISNQRGGFLAPALASSCAWALKCITATGYTYRNNEHEKLFVLAPALARD